MISFIFCHTKKRCVQKQKLSQINCDYVYSLSLQFVSLSSECSLWNMHQGLFPVFSSPEFVKNSHYDIDFQCLGSVSGKVFRDRNMRCSNPKFFGPLQREWVLGTHAVKRSNHKGALDQIFGPQSCLRVGRKVNKSSRRIASDKAFVSN